MIAALFDEEYFIFKLGIPFEYVSGFKYYIVENEVFLSVLETRNKPRISFYMTGLAQEYKVVLSSENK